jgi:hypothetical protein
MKILDTLKKLVPTKLFKRKKTKTHVDVCDLILELVSQEKKTLSNKPIDMNVEQWQNILNHISYGFRVKKENVHLKSPTRRKERQQKVERAFELFKVYIKHL